MKIGLLITLCCVSFLYENVFAEGEDTIKKDHYPFMAFVYYPNEAIKEPSGVRFMRGAVLLKPQWLVTTSVGPVMINDTPTGFPQKTLLARLGSTYIDANFTFNEDEDEQEREVIQLVRPHNRNATEWWSTEITLLKTLLPFNMTAAVGTAKIHLEPGVVSNSNCFMLVFTRTKRMGNWTEEKVLMQLFVELQTSSEQCGESFQEKMMLCASDSDATKTPDPDFCLGNSGGPLICENEVTGLQTYTENNCKQPYLYQLLSAWDNFMTCGIEEKCGDHQCASTCVVTNKDEIVEQNVSYIEQDVSNVVAELVNLVSVKTQNEEMISTPGSSEMTEEDESPSHPTVTSPIEQKITVDTTRATVSTTVSTTPPIIPSTTTNPRSEETEATSWPRDKYPERLKGLEEDTKNIERKINVEAQKQHPVIKKRGRSAGTPNISEPISLIFQFLLASLVV